MGKPINRNNRDIRHVPTEDNDEMDPLLTNIGQNDDHSCSTIE